MAQALLKNNFTVLGLDNLNDYYDIELKKDCLFSKKNPRFHFLKADLTNKTSLEDIFKAKHPGFVVNLAAQAGVRYSIDHPEAYIDSNIIGFFNVLECCRTYPVKHLLFASSRPVYGGNRKVPYLTKDLVEQLVSLYAATKKSNELMAYYFFTKKFLQVKKFLFLIMEICIVTLHILMILLRELSIFCRSLLNLTKME